jgi:uncharacterized protein (TIGR02147 family)
VKDFIPMLDIFKYTDYRQFLRDFYEAEKARTPHFSHRYIAMKVGFNSSGFFTKILQGKTNISTKLALRFADFLKLKKREADYFEQLVLFDQARTETEKQRRFEKILSYHRSEVKIMEAFQYEYYRRWYYVAIRELIAFYPFEGDFKALAKMLDPPISTAQARKAVALLEKLGLIKKNTNGVYEQTDAVISTGYEAKSVAIHNFLLATLNLASESIDRFPRSERDVSTLTMHFSRSLYDTITEKLKNFRRELLELVKNDPEKADRVFQFNFQMYPMSKPYQGPKR